MSYMSKNEKQQSLSNKKVCIFTKYSENGPSSKYRIMIFESDLKKKYDVREYRFWNEKYYSTYANHKKKYIFQIGFQFIINILKRIYQIYYDAPNYDIVFYQKCVIPYLKLHHIKALQKKGCKVIFDIDDAVFIDDKDGTVSIAKSADVVIAGNHLLRDFYGQYNSHVVLLPTVDYTPAYQQFKKDTFNNKIVFWLGSAATVDNLDLLVDPINELVKLHPEIRFKYICDSNHGYLNKIKNSEFIKWEKDSFIEAMSDITVGLMPLKDNEYNRGKCGFKLIQYMNLGKPVVASDVGINSEVVGNCGFIATNTKDFVRQIENLLYDESVYRKCEANIENEFMAKYGYKIALHKLIEVFEGNDLQTLDSIDHEKRKDNECSSNNSI